MQLTADQQKMVQLPTALLFMAGAWLIIAPWVLPKPYPAEPTWNDVVAGILLVLIALAKSNGQRSKWPEWVATGLGLWVMFAPWIIAYSQFNSPLINETVTGFVIILVASSMMLVTLSVIAYEGKT